MSQRYGKNNSKNLRVKRQTLFHSALSTMMAMVFAPLMVIVGSGSGGILSQIVGLGGGAQVPRCLGAAQELGWEDKKSVIGVINGNCVMMALLQALPTAGHFRGL